MGSASSPAGSTSASTTRQTHASNTSALASSSERTGKSSRLAQATSSASSTSSTPLSQAQKSSSAKRSQNAPKRSRMPEAMPWTPNSRQTQCQRKRSSPLPPPSATAASSTQTSSATASQTTCFPLSACSTSVETLLSTSSTHTPAWHPSSASQGKPLHKPKALIWTRTWPAVTPQTSSWHTSQRKSSQ